ncbi:MAG: GTP 3',8-cyclase MoaA [Bacteriovoracaceae bacterium]|nr:GTP 3',8-cyclase MoaA [Bacteriovoracaceae bacterium]
MLLIDKHGRNIHKLRVSLLDACNMKCFYCMPEKNSFHRSDSICSKNIIRLVKTIVANGIDEVRITGGEPLIHPDLDFITKEIGNLKLKKFGLTTNALGLEKHLDTLLKNNCKYINISLDAFSRESFHTITKVDKFNEVKNSIVEAKKAGAHVKLNTVLLKGLNSHELIPLIEFAAQNDIEIRFLELMKIGAALDSHKELFTSAADTIAQLNSKFTLTERPMPIDSTSFNYNIKELNANIGFIASETQHFCKTCSRLRLDSYGNLRPCLMMQSGLNLSEMDEDMVTKALKDLLEIKPIYRQEKLTQPMHQIGG